jgi:hypothetical protein
MQAEIRVGPILLRIEADDDKELIEKCAFWGALPDACPICGAGVVLSHRQPKGYDYYGMTCQGSPRHEVNFGQHMEGKGLFYKGDSSWQDAWTGGESPSAEDYDPGADDYEPPSEPAERPQRQERPTQAAPNDGDMVCSRPDCGVALTKGQHDVSMRAFKKALCPTHQKEQAGRMARA